jgi:pimeloyl-ACP methyl ester carboxylesterase
MAAWVREWRTLDLVSACANIAVPTLVLTGEPALDRVVPVESSLDHLQLIRGARHVMLTGTGHLGLLTRPDAFADAVTAFAADVAGEAGGTGALR